MAVVLIVEDDKNQRLLYEQELSSEGYSVITASNGKEALDRIQNMSIDLVVMDISMPKMDGLDAIGRIIGKNKNTLFVIHTAYSQFKENFMSWAADNYIVKSSDLTALKKAVNDLLTEKLVARS